MKLQKQKSILLVLGFFIFVNIILLKLISSGSIEDYKITMGAKNLTTLQETQVVSYILSNTDSSDKLRMKILMENTTDNLNSTNSNQTQSADGNYTKNDKTDVVSEVGKNIGDGLKPIIIPNNLLQINHIKEHNTILMRNIYTLFGLIFLISIIFFGYIYYTNKEIRHRDHDQYHLLSD